MLSIIVVIASAFIEKFQLLTSVIRPLTFAFSLYYTVAPIIDVVTRDTAGGLFYFVAIFLLNCAFTFRVTGRHVVRDRAGRGA